MGRYGKDYNLLSLTAKSSEYVVKKFNDLDEVSAKILYIDILKAIKGVISDDRIDSLMNLSLVLKAVSKTKSDECLKNYQHAHRIGNFNLVSLACKNKAIKALEYIFSEESQTLYNLSSKILEVRKKVSLLSVKDEFCHNAFYYAIRSNMTDLLSFLVDKWQSQYSDESLDDLLSQSYKELKLRNVCLTTEMQFFVQSKLLELRFFHASTSGSSETGNSWEEIKKRIELVVRYIKSIKTDYWNRDPDEKFIFIAEFIAKNIHVLKSLLKSTYDRLPWEEIEFCLTIFIRCCRSSYEMNMVYNCVLHKKRLLVHLINFSTVLNTQHYEFENSVVRQLAKPLNLPRDQFTRDRVIEKIIEKNSKFRELYDDYEKIRDFCSLEIIKKYSNLIDSNDATEKRRFLLVSRVLQVMGEHLKNTLDSPKLSTTTANALLYSLSSNTREVITKLRDSLSHEETLFIRSDIEKKKHVLKDLQTDISKIKAVISNKILQIKIASVKNLMKKVRSCKSSEDIKELYGPFHSSIDLHRKEIEEAFFNTSAEGDFEHLEKLILCLDKNLNDKTISERSLFDQMHCLIQKEKERSENLRQTFHYNVSLYLTVYDSSQKYNEHFSYVIQDMADHCAEISTSDIPLKKLEHIKELLQKLLVSICSRAVKTENGEIYGVIWKIFQFIDFQMGNVKWMERFKDAMNENKVAINHTLSENLLTSKLLQLKEELIDFDLKADISSADYSSFESNMEMRAVTEMLVFDILCILEKSCSRNPFCLDSDLPVLTGKNLRNHLAHGNTLIDVCLEESSIQLLINAKKILAAVLPKNNKKMDRVIKCDCTKLQSSIEDDLRIISCQQKLFVALGEGNMIDVEECVREGADVYGKDCNLSTCLHFAGKAPDIVALKWILKQGLDINAKDVAGQTVLHIAAKFNRIEVVRYLVERKHMSLGMCDKNGKTPLHVAVGNQSNDAVEYISKLEVGTIRKDEMGSTPLHYAIYMHNTDAANILLEKGTNVNENKSHGNYTVLHEAARSGNLILVKLLIAMKAGIDSKSDFGETPLHLATVTKHMEIVEAFVVNGADVNAKDEAGATPLLNAAFTGSMEIVEFLLQHEADLSASDYRQFTPLMVSTINGHTSVAELLLRKGALVNAKNDSGFTPLHFAAEKGYCEIVVLLLNFKAIVDFKNNNKETALHLSAAYGHKEVVELLLKVGADIHAIESTNSTPLHVAAARGHKDIIDILLDEGADINCKNETGSTALHFAASLGDRGIVESLLKKGANIRASDEKNLTPLRSLISRGLSELLKDEGENVISSDDNGLTLLHEAASAGDQMIVEYCIENKCDINARSNSGLTALHLAVSGNSPKIVNFLLSKGAEIYAKDDNGLTPLLIGSICNCKDALEVLFLHDTSDLESTNYDKVKALHYSVSMGKIDIVDMLFENYKFDNNELPPNLLEYAVAYNHKSVVASLLKRGFEINSDTHPLHIAVRNKHYEIVEFLLANGANLLLSDENNQTPLHIASALGDAEMVEILLSQSTDTQIENEVIFSAAELAVRENQLDAIKLLLQMKVIDVNARGKSGFALLHISALSGSLDVTRYLVAEGADINAKYEENRKPAHLAAGKGFKDMVEFYLNCHDLGNETEALLQCAAISGKAKVCELLLERNPDVIRIHSSDATPMHFALLNGHKDVLRVLLHYGEYYNAHPTALLQATKDNDAASLLRKVEKLFTAVRNNSVSEVETLLKEQSSSEYCIANAKCVKKETVLHYASWKGYNEIVEILLKYNTDPNARTKTGNTPLHYAAKFSHFSIVRALLSNGAIYHAISQTGKTPLDCAADRKIRDFFLFLKYIFKKVQDNEPSVLENLIGKDEGVMRAVIRAKSQEENTLLDVAHICDFSQTAELQMPFETDVYSDLESAVKYEVEGRYAEAFSAYECVLKKRIAIFGADSHPVLDVKFKLAVLYESQQNFDKALNFFQEVHQLRKNSLGERHMKTLYTKSRIALVLLKHGKKQDALNIFKTVDVIQKAKFELDDLNVLSNELEISAALCEMNKFDEALKIITEVEEKCSQKEDELWSILTEFRCAKAMIFSRQRKYPEALELFKDEYESRKNNLTPHHPDTLDALSGVANVLYLQEKYDESLETFKKVLTIQKSNLPEDHIDILQSEFSIGDVISDQQMLVTALKIFLSLERRIAAVAPDCDLMIANKNRIEALKERFSRLGYKFVFERIQNQARQAEPSHAKWLF
ncbi:Ankyrin-3 [Araneus ventricosus]|uniref:Alpha-latrotoxin n=1 Tax=Araneus ventricosus TaxID=182803 RepID=A0A4Y2WZB4_ARAVE|nr:Ankyrin-3 [Araneus ventricosus]